MNVNAPVPLLRRFCPVLRSDDDSDEQDIRTLLGYGDLKTWPEVDKGYRSVVLAEAGAGKTFEMRARAKYVEQEGHRAFFIRIEDINDSFEQAFEVGIVRTVARFPG